MMTGIRGNDSRLEPVQKVCLAHKMYNVNVEKKRNHDFAWIFCTHKKLKAFHLPNNIFCCGRKWADLD